MDLFIIRHAWAADRGDPRWPEDELRPLTDEGRERFARMLQGLTGRGFAPQIVATSPLVRCRQTADLVAAALDPPPEVVELEELEPGSDLGALVAWTEAQSGRFERVAWVGHAPDVGCLAAALVGGADSWIRFAKGGVAAIRFHGPAQIGQGELRWLVTAKVLGC
jgi:phosphohistidine phosphatase